MTSFRALDPSDRRARLNPAVMHAIALLDNCHNDVSEARYLAEFKLQCCAAKDFPHWASVSFVLSGEIGGRA